MKILQVVPYFPPAYAFGGPVVGVYQLSKELVKRGHQVVVYTTDAADFSSRLNAPFERVIDGIRVYTFKNLSMLFVKHSKLFLTPDLILNVKDTLRFFDVIHVHEYRTFQDVVISFFARRYHVPYILQANGSLIYLDRKRRKRFFDFLLGYKHLQAASKLVALTRFEAEQYKSFGIPDEKIVVIPSAFDFSDYENLSSKGMFRVKYNIKENEKIVLYLGRIHKQKGSDILVKAFSRIARKCKNIHLFIVGPDDGFLDELKALIGKLSIDDKVVLTGPFYNKEKLEAYVDADIFVMPSRYEAFSRSLREASACGKPVIASNVGGLRDIVVNNETGLLVAPGNVEQLTKAMLSLLVDEKRSKQMGSRGRKLMQERFSVENLTDALENLYEESAILARAG